MKAKLYDQIHKLLIINYELRNSDKLLMWTVWRDLGYAGDSMLKATFLDSHVPTPESITRCRRKIQELHPELAPTKEIRDMRKNKQRQKGTFIFREPIITQEQQDYENQR